MNNLQTSATKTEQARLDSKQQIFFSSPSLGAFTNGFGGFQRVIVLSIDFDHFTATGSRLIIVAIDSLLNGDCTSLNVTIPFLYLQTSHN
jgi:hypothetical protein